MKPQLFNTKVSSKSRDYFFDVKQSQRGDYYLVIKQSKKVQDGYERQALMVFSNLLPDFASAFAQSMQKLSELDPRIVWNPGSNRASESHSIESANIPGVNRGELKTKNSDESEKPKRYRKLTEAEIAHEQMVNARNGKPKNAGLRWSAEDRDRVKTFFLRGEAISAIAQTLERSNYSISAELKKQGLLVDEEPGMNEKPF